ncbi:odorant receptor Or2-like [Sitophilus oryzae]|uniref:Odorant receptor Or2-like n=1 Tax=Sitophilus oryzae TaxID=7048 RepID=A0A6J2XNH9_SITOR|nr:odorant receptor Or2-like [Sitophilus oryzae]
MLLIGWLVLFFMVCYYGQKVSEESMNIAGSVYKSKWYEFDIDAKLRKNIILVIARAQKPLTLKAKYMGTISLVRFVRVLRRAYSFFTLLLAVTDN